MTLAAELLAGASVWQRFVQYPDYHYALAGGVAIALLCGVLSVFVVLKRMAFIGQGISHAAFGGVGVALLLGVLFEGLRPTLARDAVIAVFCILTALLIGYLSRKGKLSEDTSIGICLAAAMALGLLLIDLRAQWVDHLIRTGRIARGELGYTPDIKPILFGNILFISPADAWVAWGVAVLVTVLVAALFKELVFFTFDEEAATVFGVRTGALYYGLLACLGVAVVAAMRSLGVILATGLLILPGAIARCWSGRIGRVLVLSAAIGAVGMIAGFFLSIWISERADVSVGPVIVLTLVVLFVVSCAVRGVRQRLRRRGALLKDRA